MTAALVSDELASQIFASVASLGALSGLILQLIHNPLLRIQSSIARLVQMETLFTGFIWQQNLKSTYIQSLYVADGILSEKAVDEAITRIDRAIEHSVELAHLSDGGEM